MIFFLLVFVVVWMTTTTAFLIPPHLSTKLRNTNTLIQQQQFMSSSDDDDDDDDNNDWYADYEEFEPSNRKKGYTNDNDNEPRNRRVGQRSRRQQDMKYTKSINSKHVPEGSELLIDSLVSERFKYKLAGDYEQADAIRNGLKSKHNILIDDRLREWSVDGNFGGRQNQVLQQRLFPKKSTTKKKKKKYTKSQSSLSLQVTQGRVEEEELEQRITALLQERTDAKRRNDYERADEIRDVVLLQDYDITIHDTLQLWSVGGYFIEDTNHKNKKKTTTTTAPRGVYTYNSNARTTRSNRIPVPMDDERRGEEEEERRVLTKEEQSSIETKLMQHYHAKRKKTTSEDTTKDNELQELQVQYGKEFQIDEERHEYYLMQATTTKEDHDTIVFLMVYDPTITTNRCRTITMEDRKTITTQLLERYQARGELRYDDADVLRQQLVDRYSIHIDDRTLEWWLIEQQQQQQQQQTHATTTTEVHENEEEEESNSTSNEEDPASLKAEELQSFTVPEIKEKLRAAGLSTTGKKAILIQRLVEEGKNDTSTIPPPTISKEPKDIEEEDIEKLTSLTIPMLQEKLRQANLPVTGKKAILIQRLMSSSRENK